MYKLFKNLIVLKNFDLFSKTRKFYKTLINVESKFYLIVDLISKKVYHFEKKKEEIYVLFFFEIKLLIFFEIFGA